jgi:hypothetical protein
MPPQYDNIHVPTQSNGGVLSYDNEDGRTETYTWYANVLPTCDFLLFRNSIIISIMFQIEPACYFRKQ